MAKPSHRDQAGRKTYAGETAKAWGNGPKTQTDSIRSGAWLQVSNVFPDRPGRTPDARSPRLCRFVSPQRGEHNNTHHAEHPLSASKE